MRCGAISDEQSSNLKMAVAFLCEASVDFKHITQCHISEDSILDAH